MTSMIEVVAKAICAEGSFCCQNTEAACNAMAWYEDAARAAIEAMAADVSVEETRRAAGQWSFRLAYTSKPQPLNEFEAGYRMGAKREGASLLEADAARAALEGERDGG